MSINNIVSNVSTSNELSSSNSILGFSAGAFRQSSGQISAAQFKNLSNAPVKVIDGVLGYLPIIKNAILWVQFNTTPYADGSDVMLFYDSLERASTKIVAANFKNSLSEASSMVKDFDQPNIMTNLPNAQSVYIALADVIDFTAGDSPVNWQVNYFMMPIPIPS